MPCNPEELSLHDFNVWRVVVKQLLPAPVRHFTNRQGVTWLAGGETAAVIVRISRRSTTVFAVNCRLADGRCLRRAMRVGSVGWSDMPGENAVQLTVALIDNAEGLTFDDLPARSQVPATVLQQMFSTGICDACHEAEAAGLWQEEITAWNGIVATEAPAARGRTFPRRSGGGRTRCAVMRG